MLLTAAAAAQQPAEFYNVTGDDSFRVGSQTAAHTTYAGVERLTIAKHGSAIRYSVQTRYTRADAGTTVTAQARFVQDLTKSGFLDRIDDDPDQLTVLNQPFAIALDLPTLHDLARLRAIVPFDANAPIAGGLLHGALQRGTDGPIDGIPSIGVRFTADGQVHGGLPEHPEIAIDGTMHMDGTAYYTKKTALLVALSARLTIDGTMRDRKDETPVHIVYARTIRAENALRESWNAPASTP